MLGFSDALNNICCYTGRPALTIPGGGYTTMRFGEGFNCLSWSHHQLYAGKQDDIFNTAGENCNSRIPLKKGLPLKNKR